MENCINQKSILDLLNQVSPIFRNEPNHLVLDSNRPIVFVGDTHGDIDSTEIIFKRFGKTHLLVFLGDYIDRAPKEQGSIENIYYLLRLKLEKPKEVIMLRGNHEFPEVFSDEFLNELDKYERNEDIFRSLVNLFAQMPYAVTTKNGLIGLHGGLPKVSSVEEITSIPKGVKHDGYNNLISQIVWNDNLVDGKSRMDGIFCSERGFDSLDESFLYGEPFFSKQMEILGKNILVRGHDYKTKGFNLNDRILTIFTSRKYSNFGLLKGAYVAIMEDPKKEIKTARDLRIEQIL